MRKVFIIIACTVCLGGCVYFVGGISATTPPIKKYEYKGTISQFGDLLQDYSKSHPEVKCKITARDSANLNVNYRDIDIEVKQGVDSLTFDIACEENILNGMAETELDLVEAIKFSKAGITGGYGSKADGMKPLLGYFENNLLNELKEKQHADVQHKKEGFFERIHIY